LPSIERDQILFCFDARLFLDHVRKAKKVATRRVKTHANTIPAMAPEFNDDVEKVPLFCGKGASEDVGEDKVVEDEDTDDASDVEEAEVGVGVGVGVDTRDGEELISVVVTVVVTFNERLVRLLDWKVVEVDVGISDTISMTVIVLGVGERSSVPSRLLLSSMSQTTMPIGESFEGSWSQKREGCQQAFCEKNGGRMGRTSRIRE